MIAVLVVVMRVVPVAGVMLMELLGAIRPLEFMAFTGNAGQRDSQDKQGEKFHRGVS